MEKVTIKDLYRKTSDYIDKDVEVSGWVRTLRDSKTFGFIEVNDGSFLRIYKLYLMILFLILKKSVNYLLVLQL